MPKPPPSYKPKPLVPLKKVPVKQEGQWTHSTFNQFLQMKDPGDIPYESVECEVLDTIALHKDRTTDLWALSCLKNGLLILRTHKKEDAIRIAERAVKEAHEVFLCRDNDHFRELMALPQYEEFFIWIYSCKETKGWVD